VSAWQPCGRRLRECVDDVCRSMGTCAWPPEAPAGLDTGGKGAGAADSASSRVTAAPARARQRSAMDVLAAAMSEDDLLVSVTCGTRAKPGLCKLFGLKWYHPFDSRRSVSGWPDLVIAGPGGVLYAELKTRRGRVSAPQREWITALEHAGQAVFVWRPEDFFSCGIQAELAAIAKPRRRAA
jgi:hypothetical protein